MATASIRNGRITSLRALETTPTSSTAISGPRRRSPWIAARINSGTREGFSTRHRSDETVVTVAVAARRSPCRRMGRPQCRRESRSPWTDHRLRISDAAREFRDRRHRMDAVRAGRYDGSSHRRWPSQHRTRRGAWLRVRSDRRLRGRYLATLDESHTDGPHTRVRGNTAQHAAAAPVVIPLGTPPWVTHGRPRVVAAAGRVSLGPWTLPAEPHGNPATYQVWFRRRDRALTGARRSAHRAGASPIGAHLRSGPRCHSRRPEGPNGGLPCTRPL